MARLSLPLSKAVRSRRLLPLLTAFLIALSPAGAQLPPQVEEIIAQGDAFDARMQSEEALAFYLRALPAAPQNSGLLRRISKQYAEMIGDAPNDEERLRLARLAVDYAERALAAPDADADARVGLAICLAKLADLSDNRTKVAFSRRIRDLCLEALNIDRDHELAHHVLGRWNLEVATMNPLLRGIARLIYGEIPPGSLAEAERLLRRALDLNSRRVATLAELARTLWFQGRRDEARQTLARAMSLPESNKDDPSLKRRAQELID